MIKSLIAVASVAYTLGTISVFAAGDNDTLRVVNLPVGTVFTLKKNLFLPANKISALGAPKDYDGCWLEFPPSEEARTLPAPYSYILKEVHITGIVNKMVNLEFSNAGASHILMYCDYNYTLSEFNQVIGQYFDITEKSPVVIQENAPPSELGSFTVGKTFSNYLAHYTAKGLEILAEDSSETEKAMIHQYAQKIRDASRKSSVQTPLISIDKAVQMLQFEIKMMKELKGKLSDHAN